MKLSINSPIRLSKKQNIHPAQLFCILSILTLIILFLCFYLSNGELISCYFFRDYRDSGMDFFHSIEYLHGNAPYEKYHTLYPPLANLLFRIFYLFMPNEMTDNWAETFSDSIAMRGTDYDLRTYQAPMLFFILIIIISVCFLCSFIYSMIKNGNNKYAAWLSVGVLLSPGMIYAFERGNIIFLVIPLILYFLKNRNSGNPYIRELSLISLAVAAGLKLYPAFFGFFLLRDKKYAQAFRTILYGILSVVLPIMTFEEGISAIPNWLTIVFSFGDSNTTPRIGTSFTNILHRIEVYLRIYLNIEIGTNWFFAATLCLTAILLLLSLYYKKDWQCALAITIAMIMFHSQGIYVYSFLCIPLILFLAEEDFLTRKNIIPFLLICSLMIHLPLFNINNHYPYVAIRQLFSLFIVIWCIITPILEKIYYKSAN